MPVACIHVPGNSSPITLKACDVTPPSVIWEAHGHVPSKMKMAKNIGLLGATVFFWALLFAPYAFYHVTVEAVPGEQVSMAADFILGMLISIGNQFVTVMIDVNVSHFGFRSKQA